MICGTQNAWLLLSRQPTTASLCNIFFLKAGEMGLYREAILVGQSSMQRPENCTLLHIECGL